MTEHQHEDGEFKLRILAALDLSPVCLHPNEIAEQLDVKADAVSVILRRLQASGFAERVDRGCWQVTANGEQYVDRIRSHLEAKT
jgi:predicted transcriptional regulator